MGTVPVRRYENAFAAISLFAHCVPQVFSSRGVQAGSRFVQEQDARVANHGYGRAEFSLVSTAMQTKLFRINELTQKSLSKLR